MALSAPRNPLTVGHCGNPGGLGHRLNPSLRGPGNDDPSGERPINLPRERREYFRPSRAGAIVGSVDRGPCADKQRVRGRTAPPVPTTSVVPLIRCADLRCTQVIEGALCLNGQSVRSQPLPQDRGRLDQPSNEGRDPNEVRVTCSERSEEQSKGLLPDPLAPTRVANTRLRRRPQSSARRADAKFRDSERSTHCGAARAGHGRRCTDALNAVSD
jgi:hypothetical protein